MDRVCRSAGCRGLLVLLFAVGTIGSGAAQEVIDRLLARVNGDAVTLSDLRAAAGLGLVPSPDGDGFETAVRQLIDRQILLAEVQRFPPPEPPAAAVEAELTLIRTRAGARLPALMESTGLDEPRLRATARDTLRIRAYVDQRFGTSNQVRDEDVSAYYRAHPEEFTRNGRRLSFDEAEPDVRQRAAAARRQATIDQWMTDLRARSEVTRPAS